MGGGRCRDPARRPHAVRRSPAARARPRRRHGSPGRGGARRQRRPPSPAPSRCGATSGCRSPTTSATWSTCSAATPGSASGGAATRSGGSTGCSTPVRSTSTTSAGPPPSGTTSATRPAPPATPRSGSPATPTSCHPMSPGARSTGSRPAPSPGLPARRIAGVDAAGLRVAITDPQSTIRHVDLWVDPDTGVTLVRGGVRRLVPAGGDHHVHDVLRCRSERDRDAVPAGARRPSLQRPGRRHRRRGRPVRPRAHAVVGGGAPALGGDLGRGVRRGADPPARRAPALPRGRRARRAARPLR